MSIKITQEMTFETDDLDLFETMLRAATQVLFSKKDYPPLVFDKQPFGFDDGRFEPHIDDRQPSIFNVAESSKADAMLGDGYVLVRPSATYGGATVLSAVTDEKIFDDKDEAARRSCALKQERKPQRQWITTLAEYPPEDKSNWSHHHDVVEFVMALCRKADTKKFTAEFAHAEPEWFDGNIGIGYRLQWRPDGGWNVLDVSMVHALYGK